MDITRDNEKIEIIIAGEPILLSVPADRKNSVRKCERDINELYSNWRAQFPRKNPVELLAMIAYQYASFYQELNERYERLRDALSLTSKALDDMLTEVSE